MLLDRLAAGELGVLDAGLGIAGDVQALGEIAISLRRLKQARGEDERFALVPGRRRVLMEPVLDGVLAQLAVEVLGCQKIVAQEPQRLFAGLIDSVRQRLPVGLELGELVTLGVHEE